MDSVDILFVVIGLQGVFLALVLLPKKQIASSLLALLLLLIGVDSLSHVQHLKDLLFLINHGNLFVMGPLLYVFLLAVIKKGDSSYESLIHLGPFVLFKLSLILIAVAKIEISPQLGNWTSYAMAVYCLGYSVHGLAYLRQQRKSISKTDLRYLYVLSGIFLTGWVFSLAARAVETFNPEVGQWVWRTTYIVAGLFIYFISWGMIRNTKMLAAKTYSYNSNPDFEQRLRQLFETKKVYLDASLNRKDVASHLGLSDHELSYHLGQHLQTSFTDFVNSYRIQEFQSRLEEGNSSLTLLGLALESGFGSKASFQRAFKKHTGQTPSTYKKKVQKII